MILRTAVFLGLTWTGLLWADESLKGIACRSVHLGYPAPVGNAFYNEVQVEQSAEGTYFMVCGWSKGYFGIQELSKGKKIVLFSVWDPASGDDPASVPMEKRVRILHKHPDVRVGRFGNEGTGGQAFYNLDWKEKETYRFLVTAKADGPGRTAYSGHLFDPDKKKWLHLVTFSTLTGKGEMLRGYYSFVEDFRRNRVSATQTRRANFGPGWVRAESGSWQALSRARFTGDANPVVNIDAGKSGDRYFLATGGNLENRTTRLNEIIRGDVGKERPPSDLPVEVKE